MAQWQQQREGYDKLLSLAETYSGEPSDDLILKKGEAVFAYVTGASLIEDRRGAGHWEGQSSGVSIPI